ncbi:leucyl aminopeptidase [Phaeovibrio sulfidiphilus]|uniref:Probable cytosol aminopeptidase n=1 Tax=Phaeovibrio sulfidiphilus TaxID=1220600 RepID=A0A8J6YR22_9PROT|nr:leucyl aminopeptidase [Phaeovibrio sulfidiphilus]MBE1237822.1 leucyl aminopeptidase [Phaeovibrio sulfidiphilus]
MKITFEKLELPVCGALVLGVFEDSDPVPEVRAVDEASGGALSNIISSSRAFTGRNGQVLCVPLLPGVQAAPVYVIGLGKAADVDGKTIEAFGAKAQTALASGMVASGSICAAPGLCPRMTPDAIAAHVAFGANLRGYAFDKYHTTRKPEDIPALLSISVLTPDTCAARTAWEPFDALSRGIFLTRNLVSEPANVLSPEAFVERCSILSEFGLDIEVLDEDKMQELGMCALLGVAQGSVRKPRLMILSWKGGKSGDAPTAIVGKGVCFDSGGISIKPAAGMEDMKWDMAGAAAVVGLMKTLALRKAPVNVVGLCGLVENMPGGAAQRPGDVVTSMSGQTIEVINTDAEGRLVLADVLYYANTRYKPKRIVDLATLTGAILISLGSEMAGLFSNSDELCASLMRAGEASDEHLWRLPMNEAYDAMINSDIADMKNAGNREAGSITAAQFLKRFVGDTPWAHIDIAGTAWSKKDRTLAPKGGSGYGVRLLDTWLREDQS